MPEGAFYQSQRASPTAFTIVLLMHGAAIGALALAKMEVIGPDVIPPTLVDLIREKQDPPPEPPQRIKQEIPQQRTRIDTPPTPFKPPFSGPTVDQGPQEPVELTAFREEKITPPADPPEPEPRKVEPARARANLASYVSDADYPSSAIRAEQQGTTRFRLSVGPNGRVTDCTVTASSGSPTLDAATCRLMKSRARFAPARDSDGRPTADTAASAIRWVLPDR